MGIFIVVTAKQQYNQKTMLSQASAFYLSLFVLPSWYFHCAGKHIKTLSADPLQGTSPECTFKFLPLILGLGSFCLFLKSLLIC